ncbi:MAG: HlyD family efflux transporter periplasmic adaptor subunit [Gammaproteobacteria bacterium]|nr:HlyD family efflux transporter periplasmic adaptor subunit [Gammaproteobacteria bacterium]
MNKVNKLWIIPPILLSIILLIVLPKFKQGPKIQEAVEKAVPVKVIQTIRLPFAPKITAYGTTRPTQVWKAITEVSGKITWISEQLKEGNIISKGTHLLSIDDTSYQLNLKQILAQIKLLEIKIRATENTLAIEQKRYQSLDNEVKRKQKLLKKGTLPQSNYDEAMRSLLSIELSIQNQKNNLELQKSENDVYLVQKAQAKLEIANTQITSPMDIRVTELNIQTNQYTNKGQVLLSADGIDAVEIEARIPIGQLKPLLSSNKEASKNDIDIDEAATEKLPGAKKLAAKVILKTATHQVQWPAEVDRVAGIIDPATQTIGVVVKVYNPYQLAQPGKRPALIRNTLVEVELQKKGKGEPIIIPQSALQQGKVLIVDSDNRLKMVKVKPMFKQGNLVIIGKGLEEDEKIVISKLIPAIEGMLLEPINDKKAMQKLKKEVLGQDENAQKNKKGQSK